MFNFVRRTNSSRNTIPSWFGWRSRESFRCDETVHEPARGLYYRTISGIGLHLLKIISPRNVSRFVRCGCSSKGARRGRSNTTNVSAALLPCLHIVSIHYSLADVSNCFLFNIRPIPPNGTEKLFSFLLCDLWNGARYLRIYDGTTFRQLTYHYFSL